MLQVTPYKLKSVEKPFYRPVYSLTTSLTALTMLSAEIPNMSSSSAGGPDLGTALTASFLTIMFR